MTDGQLLGRFVDRRDGDAFEAIVRRHGPLVLRICRGMLSDPHDADDAFQATFLVLVRSAGAIRDRDSLGRWLCGVATRVASRTRGRRSSRKAQPLRVVDMAQAEPESEPERRELLAALHAEVGRLPERLRAAIILCYLEGRSQEEAARQLRCPLGTLKGRLTRGREILRSRLSRRGAAVSIALLMVLLTGGAEAAVPEELVRSTVEAAVRALGRCEAGWRGPGGAGGTALRLGRDLRPAIRLLGLLLVLAIVADLVLLAGRAGAIRLAGPPTSQRPEARPTAATYSGGGPDLGVPGAGAPGAACH